MYVKWQDLLNVFLWNRYGTEFVQDDTAYVALLRLQKFVAYAIGCLEAPPATLDDKE